MMTTNDYDSCNNNVDDDIDDNNDNYNDDHGDNDDYKDKDKNPLPSIALPLCVSPSPLNQHWLSHRPKLKIVACRSLTRAGKGWGQS